MTSSGFDIAACSAALAGISAEAFAIEALAACDSTNTQLMRRADGGAASGAVLVADTQSAGRGRLGRTWISTPGDSLTFSLLWRFPAASSAPEALSLAVGLGVQRALAALGVAARLKWPNDVLCDGRKVAGVLIEAQPGDLKSAVIGIGINLRMPASMPADVAARATALDKLTPLPPAREVLLAVLLAQLAATLRRYGEEGFAGLREEWLARHEFQGRDVRVSGGGEEIEGRCSGITERGELLVTTTRDVRRVIAGDVSLRPA